MSAVNDGGPAKRLLSTENLRIDLLYHVTACIVIAITGIPCEMKVGNPVLLKYLKYLVLVIGHDIIHLAELSLDFLLSLPNKRDDPLIYTKLFNK